MEVRVNINMEFKQQHDGFYLEDGQQQKYAEIIFSIAGETILIIDHTYVDERYRGKKIAQKLVAQVVDKARLENKKIMPLCPFARAEFERTPEYADVKK